MSSPVSDAEAALKPYKFTDSPRLFAIGIFDSRVTVLSQQRRALNLAWSLIETKRLPTQVSEKRAKVAVVGAGFAGLTFVAALLQKQCKCAITLFEERDTLLPLQQGSDTRWLHPHIYDWPADGSDAAAAMLPVLNWTAARASDVVVQVISGWKALVSEESSTPLTLFCNTRHLQIRPHEASHIAVEWVGERRQSADGTAYSAHAGARGLSENFDYVVLSIGFGLESNNPSSYWRNEVLGQPSLRRPQQTFLVSGQGDGAMIDVLRLKISQFRQDRILAELFTSKSDLLRELRALREAYIKDASDFSLFEEFDRLLRKNSSVGKQLKQAMEQLSTRMRRDTELVLKLRVSNISDLLRGRTSRTSFQNALLIYLLYRCGGFAPSNAEELELVNRFGIHPDNVIRRHGTERIEQFDRILPKEICEPIAAAWAIDKCAQYHQSQEILWSGGYFGTRGRLENFHSLSDSERKEWRKEYLPGPAQLVATVIASAVAGLLATLKPQAAHYRVTLHRTLPLNNEELLQQACDYFGRGIPGNTSTAGRTFPCDNATIGLAFRTRRIVRSRPGITPARLDAAMKILHLNEASRKMSNKVSFVAAIPLLQPSNDFYSPSPVFAVIYFDSRDRNFDLSSEEIQQITTLIAQTIESLRLSNIRPLNRLLNSPLRGSTHVLEPAQDLPPAISKAISFSDVPPPETRSAFVLNYDLSDLTPIAD